MISSQSDNKIDKIFLYEKYKLVERAEPEVNSVWKGAHLLLFFLAFVFGSFCTFCFHMLMYLFDEKCVLFPKLLSLSSLRQNTIYEFISDDKDVADMLPVDFLSTQWVEKSTCLLPTYVPLVSAIFGLVWTTMFLMCSLGSRVLTGLQRPWRVLPPVFLFSTAMGCVCVYTSAVTHYGLQELCLKLNEVTGSTTCSYTVNVATLAYQRRIRGLYQATQLTIVSAWLHTACWLLSALLAVLRVLLVVDFKLVRVSVELQGNIDRMLERHERHISTVSPSWPKILNTSEDSQSVKVHYIKKLFRLKSSDRDAGELLHFSDLSEQTSKQALVSTERLKLDRLNAIKAVLPEHQFIVKILYNILASVDATKGIEMSSSSSSSELDLDEPPLIRQYGQQEIKSQLSTKHSNLDESKSEIIRRQAITTTNLIKAPQKENLKSTMTITSELKMALDDNTKTDTVLESTNESEPSTSNDVKKVLKSNLKQAGVQTDKKPKDKSHKVHIDSRTAPDSETSLVEDTKVTEETQTTKEKQD
ncbi:uncharacterized protein LOC112043457 [Bicyclus anynana]|uniref:Uncharacterized protein LOC112043457 n=1 Tax=Bicyclus anynana TaxID=110368 RepID=A0A6J1MP38_BICAN|nr:uncharacterized protein LOC112043457 [Bicyclus anynana]